MSFVEVAVISICTIPVGIVLNVIIGRMSGPVPRRAGWAVHAAALAVGLSAAAVAPGGPTLAAGLALGWTLLALAVIDARSLRLPNALTLPLIAAGLFAATFVSARPWGEHVVGAVAGYGAFALAAGAYQRWRGREGLGLGDAKLLAAAGAWLTWRGLPSVVLLGALAALGFVLVRAFALRDRAPATVAPEPLPFGTFLCLALWLVWLFGPLAQFS